MVVSGFCRSPPVMVAGGRVFVLPCIQQIQRISLNTLTLNVKSEKVYTRHGVPISVTGIAQVKIQGQNKEMLAAACQMFLGKTEAEIAHIALETLEGHQRAIMAHMTVEEIYKDRQKFSEQVFKVASSDLVNMGISVVSYTLKDIHDDQDYLHSLGKARTAQVQKDARIGEAEAKRDAGIREAKAKQEKVSAQYLSEIEMAKAQRDYELKKAAYDIEVNTRRAQADLAYQLQILYLIICLLKNLLVIPETVLVAPLWSFAHNAQSSENFELPNSAAEVEQDVLPSCFSSHKTLHLPKKTSEDHAGEHDQSKGKGLKILNQRFLSSSGFSLRFLGTCPSALMLSITPTQVAKTKQQIEEQRVQVQVVERAQQVAVQEQEIARREKELEARVRKPAEAERYKLERLAEAEKSQLIMQAEAEAESVRMRGEAEAFAIGARARAEAEQMAKKAEAFQLYQEAAQLDMLLEKLPQVAEEISGPLTSAKKITLVSSGGGAMGAAKVTGEVLDILSRLPESVERLTGVSISQVNHKPLRTA
ncbi:flotillin-1 isoform X1 [Prionailurus iriomotensis]